MVTNTPKPVKRLSAKKARVKKAHSFTEVLGIANTGDMKAYDYKAANNRAAQWGR